MSNPIRPHSELFINDNHNGATADVPSSENSHVQQPAHQDAQIAGTYHQPNSNRRAQPTLRTHPTILKPRHRFPRLSRIPIKSTKEGLDSSGTMGDSQHTPSKVAPSMLDSILQSEIQTILTTQRIHDLYNFASFIMPPYLAKQLAELKVMDEDAWITKFPQDIDQDSKLGAVQSLLVELGLVVARLSEMVKKDKERLQDDVD